jgi:xanthine dehydrogenase accessory factor
MSAHKTRISPLMRMAIDNLTQMRLDERCAVVALTHDPKPDDLALMEALKTHAFYVAALGSKANNEARRARLLEFDLDEMALAGLDGPAGIFIGSRAPPEIAVSILAQVVAAKNGVQAPRSWSVTVAKQLRLQRTDYDLESTG